MKMKADIEMKKLESDKRVMELIRLGKTQGGFVALSQIEEKFPEAMRTEKGLDHVTELLGRSLISIGQEEEEDIDTQESTYYDEDEPIKLYMKDIGKVPLLDAEEETKLAKQASPRPASSWVERAARYAFFRHSQGRRTEPAS